MILDFLKFQYVIQKEKPEPSNFFENLPIVDILIVFFMLAMTGAVLFGIWILFNKLKDEDRKDKSLDGVLYRVRIARSNELEVAVGEQMFANFFGVKKKLKFPESLYRENYSISLEIVSLENGIDFYVYAPRSYSKLIEDQILGTYQMAEMEIVGEYNLFKQDKKVYAAELVLSEKPYFPLKTYDKYKSDPISSILSSFTKVSNGDAVAVQIVISPASTKWQKTGRRFADSANQSSGDKDKPPKIQVNQEKLQAVNDKISKIGFYTAIRIVASADTEIQAETRVNGVIGAFDLLANPGVNNLKKISPEGAKLKNLAYDFVYRKAPVKKKTILNVSELTTMWHLPNKNVQTPLLNWLGYKKAPADSRIATEGLTLGYSAHRGVKKQVAIKKNDRRRHMYIVGKTGTGKSYFLQNLILQDIYNGEGVAFLDPHGDAVEWILERIPADRAEDVIYFNPADRERPVGFNIMEWYNESDKHLAINSFIVLMYKMYDPQHQGIVGPYFERAARNAMLTVMSLEGSSLVEVQRVLTDENWVKSYWLPKIKDDLVKRYWTDQMAQTDKFHKSEALGYLVSKFDRFVTDELMRHIIGQSKSGFDFREAMDNKKILLVNLAKGALGEENSQFLGLLIIPRLLRAAMSRSDLPEEQRTDFYLYVDEFQNFATDDFSTILSEARKYRLNLIVANQYIAQVDQKIRDAIFGNIGSVVSFKVGPDDAEYLEKIFSPVFDKNDLIGIEAINAYIRLLVDNEWPPAFSVSTWYDTSKWTKNTDVSILIKQLSRVRYGRDVNEIRRDLARRADLAVDSSKVGAGSGEIPGFPVF